MKKFYTIYKSVFLPIIFLLAFNGNGIAQNTIVNYDFNSGGSYAALTPALATGISSTVAGTETFATLGGAATGTTAFSANASGPAIAMNNSSGTDTKYWTFTLGGTNLSFYKSFKIYFQSQRSNTGAPTINVNYSLNGGLTYSNTGETPTTSGAPGNGSFTETIISFPASVNNPASLIFRLSASGGGTGTLRLDNFQVQAVMITTGAISGSPFCVSTASAAVTVPYSSTAVYVATNTFTAQLSDATGSFATPTTIGTVPNSVLPSGTISATIPAGTADGTAYRIRVVSSNPSSTGTDNGTNLVIKKVVANAGADQTICSGSSTTIGGSPSGSGGSGSYTYAWTSSPAGPAVPAIANPTVTPAFSSVTYTLTVTDAGCASAPDAVVINSSVGFTTKTWRGLGVSGGTGSVNFNDPNNWTPAGVPQACNNVVINVSLNFGADVLMTMTTDNTINNLSITNTGFSAFSGPTIVRLDAGTHSLTINGTTSLATLPTYNWLAQPPRTQISVGNGGVVTYIGSLTTTYSTSFASLNMPFYATTNNQGKFIVKGSAALGGIGNDLGNKPAQVIFDGAGTQTVTNNTTTQTIYLGATSTDIGTAGNPTTVILNGSGAGGFTSVGNLNVNSTSTLDMGAGQSINHPTPAAGTITLDPGSFMILRGSSGGATGSNFPNNYSTYSLDPTSTVDYNSTTDQTIFATAASLPAYGNLNLTAASTTTKKTAGNPLTVAGSLLITSATFWANGSTGWTHKIGGNFTNNGAFAYVTGTTNIMSFNGSTNATFSGTAATNLYSMQINKGVDTTTVLNLTSVVTTAPTPSALTFTSGKLVVQTGGNLTHNGAGPTISAAAGLHVNGGQFKLTDGTIINNGLVRITSSVSPNFATIGTMPGNSLDNNINSIFNMEGGTLNIAGRLTFSTGALSTSSISGGTITLAQVGNPSVMGTLDMTGATKINVSGGTIQLLRNKSVFAGYDVNILNTTGAKNFTGGTLQIGTGSTPASQIFEIYSEVPVYNFRVNSKSSPLAQLVAGPLKVKNTIDIFSATPDSAVLDAATNDKDISVGGTWNNNSKFLAGTGNQTVIFNGTAAQNIQGASITTFNNLKDSNTTTVNVATNANLTNAFSFGLINNATFNVNAAKFFTLLSTPTSTARIADISNGNVNSGNKMKITTTGAYVVERYYPAKRAWRLVTAPVSMLPARTIWSSWQVGQVDVPTSTGSGTYITMGALPLGPGLDKSNYSSLKTFNITTQKLDSVLNTKTLLSRNKQLTDTADNIGYFLFMRGDRRPSNLIAYTNATETTLRDTGVVQTSRRIFSPSGGIGVGKYMLIGNPYASPVDFGLLGKSNISDRFWAWDPYLNSILGGFALVYWDPLTSAYKTTPNCGACGASAQKQIIQSTQAVFVQQNTALPASVTFNESNKSATNNLNIFRPVSAPSGSQSLETNLLLPEPDTLILADGNTVQFANIFSDSVDLDDAVKFNNILENFGIVRDGKVLILERREPVTATDTVFFKLWNTTQRNYQLQFTSAGFNSTGLDGFLEDSYLHTATPLNPDGMTTVSFSVNADAGSRATDRFRVVFRPAAGPLPVTFTVVKAYRQNNNTNVEWKVENENNIKDYEVERSTDGFTFDKITTVAAKGNNNAAENYKWPDADAMAGTFYYRIRSISAGGEIRYSNIVKLTIDRGKAEIVVYPNPVINGNINLQLFNQPQGKYGVRLLNNLGQAILIKEIQHQGGSNTEILQPRRTLAHGTYLLEVTMPDQTKKNIKVIR